MNRAYLRHATQHYLIQRPDVIGRAVFLPTCPKCERAALRDKRPSDPPGRRDYVTCPFCGYHGIGGPPVRIHAKDV